MPSPGPQSIEISRTWCGSSRSQRSELKGFDAGDVALRKAIGEQCLALMRSFRKQGTVEQIGLGRRSELEITNEPSASPLSNVQFFKSILAGFAQRRWWCIPQVIFQQHRRLLVSYIAKGFCSIAPNV